MTCPFGFLVVLPDQMLLIPADSHFSWLTMFYMGGSKNPILLPLRFSGGNF